MAFLSRHTICTVTLYSSSRAGSKSSFQSHILSKTLPQALLWYSSLCEMAVVWLLFSGVVDCLLPNWGTIGMPW